MLISNNQWFLSLCFTTLGIATLFLLLQHGPLVSSYTSIGIILTIASFFFYYGPLTPPSIILSCAFYPSLSIHWAKLHNQPYISGREIELQRDLYWGEMAVHLSLISILFAIALLMLFKHSSDKTYHSKSKDFYFSVAPYLIFTIGSVFFFWLAEPAFTTIITSTYTDILDARFANTQYAGALGILLWLLSLTTFLSRTKAEIRTKYNNWPDHIFLAATTVIILWLVLHSRRNELLGIGIPLILCIYNRKGRALAYIFTIVFISILLTIGYVRGSSLVTNLIHTERSQLLIAAKNNHPYLTDQQRKRLVHRRLKFDEKIKPLPSGGSNVFLTYLTTIHYFEKNKLLYGETFNNYLNMLLPTNILRHLDTPIPHYYYEQVLAKYDYQGGTYVAAVFYGNFGIYGAVIFGVFIGFYVLLTTRFLNSSNIILQIVGLYMVGMVFRGFWYELITLIKPIFIVLLPSYIFLEFFNKFGSASLKKGLAPLVQWQYSEATCNTPKTPPI